MKCIICDIDGTVADLQHRLHFIDEKKDWGSFFANVKDDKPIEEIIEVIHRLETSTNIIFMSGRSESCREDTIHWLTKNIYFGISMSKNFWNNHLYMRPENNSEPDYKIKKILLEKARKDGWEPWLAIDDRKSIVDLWRSEGIMTFHCAPGDVCPKKIDKTGEELLHIMVGPSGAGKSSFLSYNFLFDMPPLTDHDVVSSDQIRQNLFGDFRSQENNDAVFEALHDIVRTRLSHGLTTWVDATNLRRKDRMEVARLVPDGVRAVYHVIDRPLEEKLRDGGWRLEVDIKGKNLVEYHHQRMQSCLPDILKGDDLEYVRVEDHRVS